jgi:hypothetical protein
MFLRSSLVRIIAAATVAVVLAIVVWRIAERPKTADNAALAPAGNPPGAATENAAPPGDQAAATPGAPPVTEALPTEPDAALVNSGPPVEAPTPPAETSAVPPPAPPPPAESAAAPSAVPPPANEASSAPESKPPAPADAPKFANAVPDKAPSRTSEPRAKVAKPASPHREKTSDQTVLHVRRLQTQLLVGALSCGRPHMQSSYNTFIAKFDRALKTNGQQLKAYFTRTFGARGVSEMDAFLTKLSNELSLVSMRQGEFCDRTDGLFTSVLALPASEIDAFADRYLTQPVVARDGF